MTDLEQNAWESFETGFYDEVVHLAEKYPSNVFLSHLSLISRIEEGEIPGREEFPEGESVLRLISEVYYEYSRGIQNRDTLKKYLQYIQLQNNFSCLSFFQLGIKLSYELEEYQACLFIMSKDKSGLNEEFYYRERIHSYFYLGKHIELIGYFKKFSKSISMEIAIYMKVGLSLQALGKYKESEVLLSKIPNDSKLPTFEQKKEEFQEVIDQIPDLEKRDDLSVDELKNLGFAYLFSNQYDKAERVLKQVSTTFSRG